MTRVCVVGDLKVLGVIMLKVICNFIPMDIDINISRCEYGKYDIDITCDNNVYVYFAKVKDIKCCT